MCSEEWGRRDCVQIYQTHFLKFLSGEIDFKRMSITSPEDFLSAATFSFTPRQLVLQVHWSILSWNQFLPTNLPYSISLTHISLPLRGSLCKWLLPQRYGLASCRGRFQRHFSLSLTASPSGDLQTVTSSLRMAKKLCSCSNFPLFVASELHFRAVCFFKVFT